MKHGLFDPESSSSGGAAGTALVFSTEDVRMVASLSRWMTVVSLAYYLGATLAVIGAVAAWALGGGRFAGVIFGTLGLGLAVAATWLRGAGADFQRGVLADDASPIGQGFRSLRSYFVALGLLGLLHAAHGLGRVF